MSTTSTPRRNRGWLWFFLLLVVLAAVAVASLIVYNLGQQLGAVELDRARALWRAKGPRDYRLTYSLKKDDHPVDHYAVRVRGGRIELATVNGKPLPPARLEHADMDGLFRLLDEHVRLKGQPDQPKTFLRARFDADDGHLRWYVRAPRGQERLEITVEALQALEVDK